MRHLSGLRKGELISLMMEKDEKEKNGEANGGQRSLRTDGRTDIAQRSKRSVNGKGSTKDARDRLNMKAMRWRNGRPMTCHSWDSGNTASGILEVMPDGYGFIRCANYLPGDNDVYVSPSQIRRFNLKTGDIITGNTRIKTQQEKFSALLYLKSINGMPPSVASRRFNFEDMTPIFPNERLRMERDPKEMAMRIVDLVSPIGKGQRGMVVSPPKAGKTTLLKAMAKSILENNKDMHLLSCLMTNGRRK